MKGVMEDLKSYRRWLSQGVVIDDALWFVEWNYSYLCRFDLMEEKVTFTAKIPECQMIKQMSYRYMARLGEIHLILMPYDSGNVNIVLFNIINQEFELYNPVEQNILDGNMRYRFMEPIVNGNIIILLGYSMNNNVFDPIMIGFELEHKTFFIEEEWIELLKKYCGKGMNLGLSSLVYENNYVVQILDTNALLFVDRDTKCIQDCVVESVEIIRLVFEYEGELYVIDDNYRLLKRERNGVFVPINNMWKEFSDYVICKKVFDKIVFYKSNLPEIAIWDMNEYRIENYKSGEEYRVDYKYPPIMIPVSVWKDMLLLFSYYDSKLYYLNEQFEVVKSVEMLTNFGLSSQELVIGMQTYMKEKQGIIAEGEIGELNFNTFLECIVSVDKND